MKKISLLSKSLMAFVLVLSLAGVAKAQKILILRTLCIWI